MTPIDKTSGPHSSSRRSAQLRMIGIVVLVLGLGSAGVVYWLGTRSPDVMDDISMLGYNKAQTRQMGMLYGKMGLLIENWTNDLKRPDTQAILITTTSILITLGCFYFARLLENGDETH